MIQILFHVFLYRLFFTSQKLNQWVPFGFGKRVCAGESLAISQLFIFFVMMLQQIRFELPQNHSKPNPDEYFGGFTRIAKPFYVSIAKC